MSSADLPDALIAARRRRLALLEAIGGAEAALAAPTGRPDWRQQLGAALAAVRSALDDHIAEVEASDGLLPELRRLDPRFAHAAADLEAEHPSLCAAVDRALDAASSGTDPAELRRQVLDVLVALSRHRQRGADLVYQAYNVDIGGE